MYEFVAVSRRSAPVKKPQVKRPDLIRLALALMPLVAAEGFALSVSGSAVLSTPYIWIAVGAFFCGVAGGFIVLALMKPRSDRLRYVIIGFSTLLLFAIYLVAYHGATETRSAGGPATAVISWPRSGQHVTSELRILSSGNEGILTVKGHARYLPSGSELWLVAYSYPNQTYNVESPMAVTSNGTWLADLDVFFKKRSYSYYELMVVIADSPEVEDVFDQAYYGYGLDLTYSPPQALINENVLYSENVFIR